MQVSNTFKRAFLLLMLKGLNAVHSKHMSIQERKKAIKRSADAAMAAARGRTGQYWSHALVDVGPSTKRREETNTNHNSCKMPTSKKILRRSLRSSRRKCSSAAASVVARRMMKKRTQLLRKLIPGGESLNSISLLSETADYVIHLRAQVSLMQFLAKALGASGLKSHMSTLRCEKAKVCSSQMDNYGSQPPAGRNAENIS